MTLHAIENPRGENPLTEDRSEPADTHPRRVPARGPLGAAPTLPKLLTALGLAAITAGAASAQEVDADGSYYRYGNLTVVEDDVWHQRADEFGAEEAEANSPFLPGDRIWTRDPGRVEMRLSGWITAWMDNGTKVDYVEADRPHRLGFWTGSLLLRVGADSEVVVETPGGTLTPQGEGLYRLDVLEDRRTVQFGVREGIATVANEAGSVLVPAGNHTAAPAGEAPSAPAPGQRDDEFSDWATDRQAWSTRRNDAVPYDELPVAVREHVHDLDGHGDWDRDHEHGWVWYPTVGAGWSPYHHGRWAHSPFGYNWISYDPWGWAPFHYGRWGHGVRGWYWRPGAAWSPGWVSWSYGYDWIGWSPLNRYGYSVYGWNDFHFGGARLARGTVLGTAVRRGGSPAAGQAAIRRGEAVGWSFTNRSALGRVASRNRLDASRLTRVEEAQVLERGAVLDRGLRRRAIGETAIARAASATASALSNTGNAASRRQRAVTNAGRAAAGWGTPLAQEGTENAAGQAAALPWSAGPASAASRRIARPRTAADRSAASGRSATPRVSTPRTSTPRASTPRTSTPRASTPRTSTPRTARPRSGTARPRSSTARPRSGGDASAQSRSGVRNRPSTASRARPRSGASSRPSSTSRSRPSAASRPRSSSGASSRPSSRPSTTSRSRPSAASRPRSGSGASSRPSSASRPRPSAASRPRPSSGASSQPSSRPSSSARPAPRSSGSSSGGSRARPRRPSA